MVTSATRMLLRMSLNGTMPYLTNFSTGVRKRRSRVLIRELLQQLQVRRERLHSPQMIALSRRATRGVEPQFSVVQPHRRLQFHRTISIVATPRCKVARRNGGTRPSLPDPADALSRRCGVPRNLYSVCWWARCVMYEGKLLRALSLQVLRVSRLRARSLSSKSLVGTAVTPTTVLVRVS